MNAVVLVIEDDAEGDPYDGVGTSNEVSRATVSYRSSGRESRASGPYSHDHYRFQYSL